MLLNAENGCTLGEKTLRVHTAAQKCPSRTNSPGVFTVRPLFGRKMSATLFIIAFIKNSITHKSFVVKQKVVN